MNRIEAQALEYAEALGELTEYLDLPWENANETVRAAKRKIMRMRDALRKANNILAGEGYGGNSPIRLEIAAILANTPPAAGGPAMNRQCYHMGRWGSRDFMFSANAKVRGGGGAV